MTSANQKIVSIKSSLKSTRLFLNYEPQENPEGEGPQAEESEAPSPGFSPDLEKADKRRTTFPPLQSGQQISSSFEFQTIFSKILEQYTHRYS